jgi:hypothetical protein
MDGTASMRQRALAVLRDEMPPRLPFITRLEAWYRSHTRLGTMPDRFRGLSLDDVHAAVGVGRLKFVAPFAVRLCGVAVRSTFNGEEHYRAHEPIVENFPGMWDIVPTDRAGETVTELITPRGRLALRHRLHAEGVRTGTDPYLVRHLLERDEDFAVAEYILERAEVVPQDEAVRAEELRIGTNGLAVPLLYRIPFQQALLEYLGEIGLFKALRQRLPLVSKLLELLDQQMMQIIDAVRALDVPYVEFPDNLHGPMTSPALFRDYCLPAYQKYCEVLHAQGKKVGSHADGNIRPLLRLLPETGLDVCESFSPYPLTPCTFDEAWEAWRDGPRIWGGVPSPILEEERYTEAEFRAYMSRLMRSIDRPMILGVVDLFMHHNSIERVIEIASWVEAGGVPQPEEIRSEG